MSTLDQLAAIAEALAALDVDGPTPIRSTLADVLRARTYTAPRGVTFTTPADGEGSPIYVENTHGRIYDEATNTSRDGLTTTKLTVYGTLTRGERTTRGAVEVWHHHGRTDDPTRAYWRNLTGAAVPDGARENVAARVLADLEGVDWPALAAETDAADRRARISRHISEAARAVGDASRAIAAEAGDR
jgi:hypothetical protein